MNKIRLNTDGSATFTGDIQGPNFDFAATNSGSGYYLAFSNGCLYAKRAGTNNGKRFLCLLSALEQNVVINADGSAEFAGACSSRQMTKLEVLLPIQV